MKYNQKSLSFTLLFFPNCFSYEKSRMSRLIFSGFPVGLLGNLRPVALEAAKIIESVKVLIVSQGLLSLQH